MTFGNPQYPNKWVIIQQMPNGLELVSIAGPTVEVVKRSNNCPGFANY
jgi:hypothetical protein